MEVLDQISRNRIRRVFRAKRKLNASGLVSHITQRSAGKEPLFLEDSDYLYMLVLLKEISYQHGIKIYAFCLMENHIHLLLRPEGENLYDAMRDLFSRYAMWFNKKYERKGHLFGGPYRQAVCLDDGYLVAASVYIHLNPVKAGLDLVAEDYRWSSVRLYCEEEAPASFVDTHFILNILSGNAGKGKEAYRDLLNRGVKVETKPVFEEGDVIERFRSRLVSLFPSVFKRMAGRNRAGKAAGLELLSMEVLEERIENLKHAPFTNEPETRPAKRYLIEQLISRGYKRAEIAEKLGVSRKTIYNILNRPT
jgi:putative transposase